METALRQILILHSDRAAAAQLAASLRGSTEDVPVQCHVDAPYNLEAALRARTYDLIVCEFTQAAPAPAAMLRLLQAQHPQTPLIFVAGVATLRDAVDMLRLGASGFVELQDDQRLLELVGQELTAPFVEPPTLHRRLAVQVGQFNDILATMQDAMLSFSLPERQLIFASASVEKVFGYPIKQFYSNPNFFREVVHPDDLELAVDAMQSCVRLGYAELEHRVILPDGQVRWLHRRAWVNYDAAGRPVRVNDSARDITRQKQIEAALRASEEQFQQFMSHLPGAVFIKDSEGRTLYCNNLYAQMCGCMPADIIGRHALDYLPAEVAEAFLQENAQVYREQRAIEFKHTYVRPETVSHWLTLKFLIPQPGRPSLIGCVSLDVTKEKQAEMALRESEAHLRSLFDSQTTFNVRVNMQGNITFCNDRYAKQFAWLTPSPVGLSSLQMVHPADQQRVGEAVERCMAQLGAPVQVELRKPVQTGGYFWTLWEFIAVQDAEGTVKEIQCVGFDISKQKEAEASLRASEERQRAILSAIPDLMFRFGADGAFLDYHTPSDSLLLLPPNEFLGRSLTEVLPPPVAQQLIAAFAAMRDGQPSAQFEFPLLLHGEPFAFEARVAPSGVDEVLVMVRDVTKRKHAEEALLEAHDLLEQRVLERTVALEEERNLLRTVIDAVPDFISVKDRLHRFVLSNKAHAHSLGVDDPLALVGRTDRDLFPPAIAARLQADEQNIFETERAIVNLEEHAAGEHGDEMWTLTTKVPLRNLQGEMTGLVGITHDMTEIKATEAALRASEEKFRQFIESAPIAAIITDQNGGVVLVNQESEKIFGFTREELIGRPIETLVPAAFRDIHPARRRAYLAQPEGRRVGALELAGQRKDGSVFPVEIQLSYIRVAPADLVMIIVIDITARRAAEDALHQALKQEKELGELKSRFVSMASHEFRTPLAAILAVTETLTLYRDRMDKGQVDARLDKIRQQVDHMKGVMEDVLQLARIQAGRVEFSPAPGRLDDLCRQIVEEFESMAEYQQRVHLNCPVALPPTFFDQRLLRQVFVNLLSNALKYSPQEKPVHVELLQDPQQVVLRVSDEGIGIPSDDLKHLFEPFHRAANVGAISGTGLGLSITKRSVELHGGAIAVASQVGQGTTITVTLPLPLAEG